MQENQPNNTTPKPDPRASALEQEAGRRAKRYAEDFDLMDCVPFEDLGFYGEEEIQIYGKYVSRSEKKHEHMPEQLTERRRAAERLLQEAPERILGGSPRHEPDGLSFDWEIPELTKLNLLTFIAEVHCQGDKSQVRFQIDLAKLQTPELEELHNILARRHAGLDDRRSLLRSIEWMLTISLSQTSPHLTEAERKRAAQRELLLAEVG